MKYNFKEIGLRIRAERKAAGFKSQDDLIDCLRNKYGYSISRNTLSAIEKGKTNHYDVELLADLCELFNCEMGYLLCEYECKTGRNTDISAATGLSEEAIEKLSAYKNSNVFFSKALTNKQFYRILCTINSYLYRRSLEAFYGKSSITYEEAAASLYDANRFFSAMIEEIGNDAAAETSESSHLLDCTPEERTFFTTMQTARGYSLLTHEQTIELIERSKRDGCYNSIFKELIKISEKYKDRFAISQTFP